MTTDEIAELIETIPRERDADQFLVDLVNRAIELDRKKMAEPVAWMFTNRETGNVVFFNRRDDALGFSLKSKGWDMDFLYIKPFRRFQ
jgi:hypothetical protein